MWFQWKKFRHTTPTRPMDRRNDPVEAVRAMIDQLTYLQLMVVLGMLSDELSWRYRVYRWQEIQQPEDTSSPPHLEGPPVIDGSTASGSEPGEEVAEEVPPPKVPTQTPRSTSPNWRGEPPWKRRRRCHPSHSIPRSVTSVYIVFADLVALT